VEQGPAEKPKPLTRQLLECVAAAMGLNQGHETLYLGFQDGQLRRWSRRDEGNGARELARFDEALMHELRSVLGSD
jgi:hypothetical protein